MGPDTGMGGSRAEFPQTRTDALAALHHSVETERRRAWDDLVRSYWKPVYKHIRRRWQAPNDTAKDLTQGFFVDAMERRLFEQYDPARAAFRTYVRLCADGYVANQRKAAARQKRGGGIVLESLDFDAAEREFASDAARAAPDAELFEQEWVRAIIEQAVAALRDELERSGKGAAYALFAAYDLNPEDPRPTYAELAERHQTSVTQVTNHLAAVRRRFREHVLTQVRRLTASDAEFREEARRVLGIDLSRAPHPSAPHERDT